MKKIYLSILLFLFAFSHVCAQAINISESKGWLESAYVKWEPLNDATSYNVYYKAADAADSDYKQINSMLIRKYADYFRADVVGLKADNYVMKVVPVINENEDISKQVVSGVLTVKAYVREGFAFSQNSPLKTGSGAYNDDGTLKSDANVLYLTAKTANTMELAVVVDGKGKTETRVGIVDILAGKQKGYDKTPLAIRVVGEVKGSNITGLNGSGYIQIKGKNSYSELNITVEGIGDDATANGWALLIRGAGNIEVRNLAIMNFDDDGVSLDTENTNIWVHNNDFFYGKQGSGDKAKGDGSFDVKGDSKYITSSYNHFWDAGKASLCGMTSESGPNYITYHHNWFDHSDSRHPRVRTMTVHVYNNYFDGIAKYGVGATTGSSVFVENNYFRNSTRPMMISLQGTDVINGTANGTFSGESGGMIKSFGNKMVNTTRTLVYHTQNNVNKNGQWDAIETATRDEKVAASYTTVSGGNTYNNFDTDAGIMYSYTPETADDSKNTVMAYAGRVNGGDLKWVFDDSVDDASYDINQGLRTAVNNYKGTVLAIGSGNSGGEEPTDPTDPTDPVDPVDPAGDVIHNFTESDMISTFFDITGALSTSKGTVVYGGLTLTQCLKIESKTNISFTTTKKSTLTLVFNDAASGKVKINGTDYDFTNGVLTTDLEAGEYNITKNTTLNLYYMSVKFDAANVGIEKVEATELVLYPNPVEDNLYINSNVKVVGVEVYSVSGSLVLQTKGNDIEYIDMSKLSKGSYIVSINTAQGLYRKVVIKK